MHCLFSHRAALVIQRALCRFLSHRGDAIAGVAAIEFAIIAPILVLLMLCTVDVGMGFYRKMQVQNAARAGAQYALTHGFAVDAISSAVLSATGFSGISASPTPNQFCACASDTGLTTVACDSPCLGGILSGTYVSSSALGTYNTIVPYPMIPNSFTFTAQSTVRVQ